MKPEPNICIKHQCFQIWDEENVMYYCPKCRENFLATREEIAEDVQRQITDAEESLVRETDKVRGAKANLVISDDKISAPLAKKKHACPEWDYLVIDENDPEFEACLCFQGEVKTMTIRETYPPGEPILIPGKRYAYTTSGAPTGCTRKKWWNMEVIHHVPQLHKVWVKMEQSGIHRVIGTAEFTFKLLE